MANHRTPPLIPRIRSKPMITWEYKIETVGGMFKSRATKLNELRQVCNMLGQDGWELVNIVHESFADQYVASFKKPVDDESPE